MEKLLREKTAHIVNNLYGINFSDLDITVNQTSKEFVGDFTVVIFPFVKIARKKPEEIGKEIGDALQKEIPEIDSYNVVKGFVNFKLKNEFWNNFLLNASSENYFSLPSTHKKIMVEYAGPNTNKPLHLGHIRNIFIGYSVSEILKAAGNEVVKVNIYNDRGIHICKSMLAYEKYSNNETPKSKGIKGDHLVGDFYVKFDQELKIQIAGLMLKGMSEEEAKKNAPLNIEVKEMLLKWEAGDAEVRARWEMMNGWVYEGFEETYQLIGCDFNKHYKESDTYLLGKNIVEEGLSKNVFYKRPDGAVCVDLTSDGLDEKVLMRSDGTSVYITQDLGTADLRYQDFEPDQMIYTVANEQDYHFKVLKLVTQKLGKKYADGINHLSYGMVDLPTGRMKSREGTVVDADDLIEEMIRTAKEQTLALGKTENFSEAEAEKLYYELGMGALKFFILKVDPRKRMIFNPEESIDFHGFTGPFIQYTYARIQSVKRKAGNNFKSSTPVVKANDSELQLLMQLYLYTNTIKEAAMNLDPALLANHIYFIAKSFNSFYAENSITQAETEELKNFRLLLSDLTGSVIKRGMKLLGIEVPERM
ncbi:arginine--tRNA ligase [Bacteroidota bacterium]|nr:arginine--tRNA ligase [Bacteroidota bacterium]